MRTSKPVRWPFAILIVFAAIPAALATPIVVDLGDGRSIVASTLIVPFGPAPGGAPAISPPSAYDGVARLIVTSTLGPSYLGSGVLIADQWLVTAAHLLDTNADGVPDVPPGNISVTFNTTGGPVTLGATATYIYPGWTGASPTNLYGHDIAIIQLDAIAPAAAQRYALYTASGEVGPASPIVDHLGYGLTGTDGNTGATMASGTLRWGENTYDGVNLFNFWFPATPPGTQLNYDFDNGLTANDAAGVIFGIVHLGLGYPTESLIAPGDSGGPAFINGLLAGIHSYGLTFAGPGSPDVDGGILNSSFGEFAGDTRVSYYANWIYATAGIPEPSSLALVALGVLALARRRGRARASARARAA